MEAKFADWQSKETKKRNKMRYENAVYSKLWEELIAYFPFATDEVFHTTQT
jgi:hypothetical protein